MSHPSIRDCDVQVSYVKDGNFLSMRVKNANHTPLHAWVVEWCTTHGVDEPVKTLRFTHGYDRVLEIHRAKRFLTKTEFRMLSSARVELEPLPGYLAPRDKLLSYYFLALAAHLNSTDVVTLWEKLPHAHNMLSDTIVAAALCTLHPRLFKKIPKATRNNKIVCRIAFTLWDLAESVLQYVAPRTLVNFGELAAAVVYSDSPFNSYWVFDDPKLVMSAVGPPSRRRWYELEHAGPRAVEHIIISRFKRNSSINHLLGPIRANGYVQQCFSKWLHDENPNMCALGRSMINPESNTLH